MQSLQFCGAEPSSKMSCPSQPSGAGRRRLHALAASSPVSLWEFVRPGLDEELSIVESFARQVAANFSRPLVKSSQEGLHLDGAEAICRSADSDDFSEHAGYIPAGEDLHIAEMTLDQAKDFCRRLELCNGFTLQAGIRRASRKMMTEIQQCPPTCASDARSEVQDGDSEGWRSFRRERHKVRHGPDAVPPQAANCYKEGADCLRKFPAMFWRSHMAVLFLHQSDDFEGGFYFTPHFNSTDRVWVNPAVGKAVAFAAGAHNLHGLDISSGQLCTLSLWLTPDASRASRVLEAATDELEEL
ncbi:unnamed protein product [Effrenium voratum]|uniref:Uncharacterized protein n=1 Tax=Effrenium voratum TaxID=2562239 RepID=A0AA36HWD2_9DINO|nr:unnamed protein product [Effrenium voratum]